LADVSSEPADPWKEGAHDSDQNEITEEAVNREAEKVLNELDQPITLDDESTAGHATPPIGVEPDDLAVPEQVSVEPEVAIANHAGDDADLVPGEEDLSGATPVAAVEDENDGFQDVKSGRKPARGRGRGGYRGRGGPRGGHRGGAGGPGGAPRANGRGRGGRGGNRGGNAPRGGAGGDNRGKKYVPKNNESS
jgi:hypothetical protein